MRYLWVVFGGALAIAASGSSQLGAQSAPPVAPVASHGQTSAPEAAPAATASAMSTGTTEYQALLKGYCVGCHNQRTKLAGVMFDAVDLNDLSRDAVVWEKTIRKLRAGMMPPPGAKRPDTRIVDGFAGWLETSLDREAAQHPDPGRIALHRLNRAEYANAIEELLGVKVDAAALLPKDDEADGFDNIASSLKVSPTFIDQYVSAARHVTLVAIGKPAPKPEGVIHRPPPGTDQSRRVEGLPPGTRGGFLASHRFPADGEYKLNIGGLAAAFYIRGIEYPQTVVATLDGVKVFEGPLGGWDDMSAIELEQAPAVAAINGRFQNIPLTVKAGVHEIGVTFIEKGYAESDEVLQSFVPGAGEARVARVGSVEIVGPYNPTGISETAGRQKIFVCRPPASATPAQDEACAHKIVANIARVAFRRPVTDAEIEPSLQFFRETRKAGTFDEGIQVALMPILASPKFLFRAERVPAGVAPGAVYAINDFELASRLSFFLAGGPPDSELLDLAEAGRLRTPAVLEKQVHRLLAGKQFDERFTNFSFQWLKLRTLGDVDPDGAYFPNYDAALRESFKEELSLFIQSIAREDRSILDFLTANYTFLNERLALHYGIKDVRGQEFRRVTLADSHRWGLTGKGAILMATSYGNRTSPVLRGAWLLETIIGTPPASPPPNVEAFKENKPGERARTIRGILEEHRGNPTCNACHGVIDPLGLALENFDAIGSWRDKDRYAGEMIDSSGRLVDGTIIEGPDDLRTVLTRRPEEFVQTFTEKLFTFALGRGVEAHDMPVIRKIVREAAQDKYRFSSIVMGIVKSMPFQMRKSSPVDGALEARAK